MRRPAMVNALIVVFLIATFSWNLYMNINFHVVLIQPIQPPRRIITVNRTNVQEPTIEIRPLWDCEHLDLLVVIPSVGDHYVMRQVIREKWNQDHDNAMKIVFLLGTKTDAKWEATMERILNESRTFDDIILTDVVDHHRNLTMKTWTMMLWANRYCPVRCLFKTDEDSVVNVGHIRDLCNTSKESQNGTIIGKCYAGVVIRDPHYKDHVPQEVFKPTHYPTFCAGVGYLMIGRDLTARLLNRLGDVRWNDKRFRQMGEDVIWTGILGEKARVPRLHNNGFSSHKTMKFECNKTEKLARAHLMHYYGNPVAFRKGWDMIQENGTKPCS